jgi:hypothetical protein
MMPPVIGLTGKAGAGKDSFYRLVLAPRGYIRLAFADAVRGAALGIALATHMGARSLPDGYADFACLAISGALVGGKPGGFFLDRSAYYYTWYGQEKDREVRRALQHLGTEVGRGLDPNLWVYALLQEVKRVVEAGGRVAITDVRFPNEAAALRGDVEGVLAPYLEAQNAILHVQAAVAETWEKGGLVVPRGLGAVIRVRRTGEGLEGEAGRHASELGVEAIQPDHVVEAGSLMELKEKGDELFGPVWPYLRRTDEWEAV